MQVVTPGSERVIRGEGMPISKAPGQKGNLRLQMDVQARALLHAWQFSACRPVLCSGSSWHVSVHVLECMITSVNAKDRQDGMKHQARCDFTSYVSADVGNTWCMSIHNQAQTSEVHGADWS